MKHTLKKVAAIVLAALMCVSTMVSVYAADAAKCPGTGATHTATNCTFVQVSEQKATCTVEGFVTGKCTTCSAVFNASRTDALGHDWNDIVPATCDTPATRTCKACDTKITVSPALTHLYTAYTVSGGVCKTGERISRECIYCGDEQKKTIGAEGHEFALASYVEPSNCLTDGQAMYTCVVDGCGASKIVPIKANSTTTAHSYAPWATVKGANVADPNYLAQTCTISGRSSIICTLCGDVKVISNGKKNHTLSPVQALKPATCTTPGLQAYCYCIDCRAYFNEAGTAIVEYADLVIPAHHNNPDKLTITIEQNPTCADDGWRYVSCTVCDTYKDQRTMLPKYTNHLYYANVTKTEDKINILKALNLYTTDAAVAATWESLASLEANSLGKNTVWSNYVPANCTNDASVSWLCLNCSFNEKNNKYEKTACTVVYTARPAGDEYVATGHKFADVYPSTNTLAGVAYTDSPAAKCTSSGVRVYDCVNEYKDASGNTVGCNATQTQFPAALGHKWEETASTPATCRANGTKSYACVNGCNGTKTETVYSSGTEHNWAYVDATFDINSLKCGEIKVVERYCLEANCPASLDPKAYQVVGPDHKYYDVTVAANLEAIKALNKTTNPYITITVGETQKAIVEYVITGNCERGATYKLICEKCDMFKSFEISEGFKQGHKKTYINNSSLAATCSMNGGSNQWYCSNLGCTYYADDTNGTPTVFTPGRDTVYAATHYLWDATANSLKTVDYKNVPDVRVSGAASANAAKLVEAPVDSNGIVIRAVAIDGTSLVWVYKYTAKNHTEATIANGGLYCVECQLFIDQGTRMPTALGHSYTLKANVAATCQNYGYKLFECACGDSYQTEFKKVSTHSYLFLNATNRELAWTSLTAAQKEGRAYVAPSCAMAGYAIDMCTVCKATATVSIPAIGHKNKYGQTLTTSCLDVPTDRV